MLITYPEYLVSAASITLMFALLSYLLYLLDLRQLDAVSDKIYHELIRHTLLLASILYASAALTYCAYYVY